MGGCKPDVSSFDWELEGVSIEESESEIESPFGGATGEIVDKYGGVPGVAIEPNRSVRWRSGVEVREGFVCLARFAATGGSEKEGDLGRLTFCAALKDAVEKLKASWISDKKLGGLSRKCFKAPVGDNRTASSKVGSCALSRSWISVGPRSVQP